MKRIGILVALVAVMMCGAGAARAVDVKVKGSFNFVYGVGDNLGFRDNSTGDREDDNFFVQQRMRTQINFIASEYVQGVVMFEIGDIYWGRDVENHSGRGAGGSLDTDGVNVETKHAYLDFLIPNTDISVRMGLQYLALPMGTGYGNPVFGADVAGVVTSYKFNEMFALTAFWARPFDQYGNDTEAGFGPRSLDDEVDMFGLVAPVTGDGWSVTPWFVYSRVGSASGLYEYVLNYQGFLDDVGLSGLDYDANESTNAWWLGGAFSLTMFDPLTFGLDVMYGSLGNNSFSGVRDSDNNPIPGEFDFETRGWFLAANVNYTLDWGVPGIFGWWSSGDDAGDVRDGKFGRIPTVGMDDGFAATSFGTTGSIYGVDTAVSETMVGTWGIGIQLADMSFVENLSHTIRVSYYQGTNDKELAGTSPDFGGWLPINGENIYLTTKDSAWEVNFDHQYQMYENLSVYLELGYITLDMDDSWNDYYDDNAFRGQVGFVYSF